MKIHEGDTYKLDFSKTGTHERAPALAKKYNAAFVGLTLGVEGFPRDANERGLLQQKL
jgi:hypothetical protein